MAKGQKHGNREVKKPKSAKKPVADASTSPFSSITKPLAGKTPPGKTRS